MPENFAHMHWLVRQPQPVLYTACWDLQEFPEHLREVPLTHVYNSGWAASPSGLQRLAERLRSELPNWRHLVIYGQRRVALAARDRDCHPVHPHAMLGDSTYVPLETSKHYRAVLMARAVPWKRHKLAAQVERLICIAADFGDAEYDREMKRDLPRSYFVPSVSPSNWLDSHVCAGYYSQSRVGLALSALEGECRAFGEYQLCGLPVVTTGAAGGRAETGDPEFMRIVPPCPQAVATAVKELIQYNCDPQQVREAFLSRIGDHRRQLEGLLGLPVDWQSLPGMLPWVNMVKLKLPEGV